MILLLFLSINLNNDDGMRLKSIILQTPELNNLKPFQSLHNKVHQQYTKKV